MQENMYAPAVAPVAMNLTHVETPYDRLIERSKALLALWFPTKHNEIYGGLHDRAADILTCDALLTSGAGGGAFHRLDPDVQERLLDGIEELMFEMLPARIVAFYGEKLEDPNHVYH